MIVLVCGGRDYRDRYRVYKTLDTLHKEHMICQIVQGEAWGADQFARAWAELRGITCRGFPAKWHRYGRAAGMLRNKEMLLVGKPDLVVAFPGGKGTLNMITQAEEHNIKVMRIE